MNLQQDEVKVKEEEITDPYEAGVYYMKKKKIEGKLLFCMVRESIDERILIFIKK